MSSSPIDDIFYDDILVRIISFIPTKQFNSLSILSKNFNVLMKKYPSIYQSFNLSFILGQNLFDGQNITTKLNYNSKKFEIGSTDDEMYTPNNFFFGMGHRRNFNTIHSHSADIVTKIPNCNGLNEKFYSFIKFPIQNTKKIHLFFPRNKRPPPPPIFKKNKNKVKIKIKNKKKSSLTRMSKRLNNILFNKNKCKNFLSLNCYQYDYIDKSKTLLQLLNLKNFKNLIHFGYRFSDSFDLMLNVKNNEFFRQLKLLDLHENDKISSGPLMSNNSNQLNVFVKFNAIFENTNNLIAFKFIKGKNFQYQSNFVVEQKIKIKFPKRLQFISLDGIDEYCTYDFSQCNDLIGLKLKYSSLSGPFFGGYHMVEAPENGIKLNEIIWPKNKIGGVIIEGSEKYCQLWENYIKNNILPVNCFKFIGYETNDEEQYNYFFKNNLKIIKINQLMDCFNAMDEKKNDIIIIKDELFQPLQQQSQSYPPIQQVQESTAVLQRKIENFRRKQKFDQLWRLLLQKKFCKNEKMNVIELERMYDKWFNFGIVKWIQYIEFPQQFQQYL